MVAPDALTDPITFEIISHRLHQITQEMAMTLERSGCTVNTTQAKDYISALYRANGDILSAGENLIWQVPCAGLAVKAIMNRFQADGGILPGDVFMLNDPYVAAVHQSDVYVLAPIHYDDQLAGWSATFVHVMDIGAMSFGGNSPGAREVCQEGVRIAGIKLVEQGRLRKDVFEAITNMTRQPVMVALDLKCELAANNVARDRLQQLYAQYGPDLVDRVAADMIGYSERALRGRIAEMPDGRWEAAKSIDADEVRTMALTLRKEEDHLVFDFTGTDPQARVGINLPVHGTFGACFGAVASTLGYDIPKNHGMCAPIEVVAIPGTLVYPEYPAPVSLSTSSGAGVARYLATSLLSQLVATNEAWQEEAMAQNAGNRYTRTAGMDQWGHYYAASILPLEGGGARSRCDGTDSWGIPLSRDNIEWAESTFPLLHLFCRHIRDGAGAGKFRGGAGEERAVVVHHAPEGRLNGVAFGVAGLTNSGQGLFGGHPAAPSLAVLVTDTRVRELLANHEAPDDLPALGGRATLLPYCEFELGERDVLWMRASSGGGYGDPLERDPGAVLTDLVRGIVSPEAAQGVYGVVLREEAWDPVATDTLRNRLRAERRTASWRRHGAARAAGTPALSGTHGNGAAIIHPLREGLALFATPEGKRIGCSRCGRLLCEMGQDWRKMCQRKRWPASRAGPLQGDLPRRFRFEQLLCPSCGALLNSEIVEKNPADPRLEAAKGRR